MMKKINNDAPVVYDRTIDIEAEAAKIWCVLTNIDRWPEWQKDITEAKLHGKPAPATNFEWKSGGLKIQSEFHTVEPYWYVGWTGKVFGIYAIHNWKLIEKNGVTIVQVEESMEGLLSRVFRRNLQKNLEKGMTNWMEMLKAECERV
jgi:hypothetical protein